MNEIIIAGACIIICLCVAVIFSLFINSGSVTREDRKWQEDIDER